jgi:hypothetical protein
MAALESVLGVDPGINRTLRVRLNAQLRYRGWSDHRHESEQITSEAHCINKLILPSTRFGPLTQILRAK